MAQLSRRICRTCVAEDVRAECFEIGAAFLLDHGRASVSATSDAMKLTGPATSSIISSATLTASARLNSKSSSYSSTY